MNWPRFFWLIQLSLVSTSLTFGLWQESLRAGAFMFCIINSALAILLAWRRL